MKQSSRRNFLGQALTAAGTAIAAPAIINQATTAQEKRSAKVPVSGEMAVTLMVNGQAQSLTLEPRVTLLDALQERLESRQITPSISFRLAPIFLLILLFAVKQ